MKHKTAKERKKNKSRYKIVGTPECPRLSVFRSNKHIYAQAIDDKNKVTLAALSTVSKKIVDKLVNKTKKEQSYLVGQELGKALKDQKKSKIVFDRGWYKYHGRVKELAKGLRDSGVSF